MRQWTAIAVIAILGATGSATQSADGTDWIALGSESIELLRNYVRIESVNPPADSTKTVAFLKGILEKEGIPVRTFTSAPGKVTLLARLGAETPAGKDEPGPLLLLHHMDVVPVDRARWPVDPFGGELHDGFVHGRGTADMKGLGIVHLMAMIQVKRWGIPLQRDILLMATPDEESGGLQGAKWMIDNHWDELAPEYVMDEGGFGSRDVVAADGRLVFGVSVAEKKILWAKITAIGTAGHGSQPLPDNANDLLVGALDTIRSRVGRGGERNGNPVVDELKRRVGLLADNKFMRAIQADTLSLTTLRAGVGEPPKVNVIPSVAEATIDARLLPETDLDHFLDHVLMRAAGMDRLTVEVINRMDDTPTTPHQTALFAAIEKAILSEHPEATVAPMLIPYGTDSNAFRVRGAKAYGINPMVLDASIIGSMHSDAERIPVAEMERAVRIMSTILRDFCGRK